MITRLKPYPHMHATNVAWLGELPKHWEVTPNRALFEEVRERNRPEAEMLSVTIKRGVIKQQSLLDESSKKDGSNQDKSAYKFVRPGDIAYNKMRAWQGALGASDYCGIISPAYVVERPRKGLARYFHYLLRTPAFAREAERWSYGITSDMWSLRPEHFKMIYGCCPPIAEQFGIVRFLDHIEGYFDHCIRAKQRLIQLLEELRLAIIQHTVTRGLNPEVEFKHSGVDWIGNTPEHWKIVRLKSLMQNIVEHTAGRGNTEIYVAMEHVESWTGRLVHADFDAVFESQVKRFRSGDILFGKLRPYLAKVTRLGQSGICVGEFLVLRRICSNADPCFLEFLLRSKLIIDEIDRSTFGAKMPRADWSFMGRLAVAIPPPSEQSAIAEFLDRATADLDATVTSVRQEVSLLQEYHTRLISDVVTGKLDVREVADLLPADSAASDKKRTL